MATEIQTRYEIADKIRGVAPLSVVVPRNIVGTTNDDGWLGALQSPAFGNKIRGYCISLQARRIVADRGNAAEYDLVYLIRYFLEYWTGDDTNNSQDVASAELEAVVILFAGEFEEGSALEQASPIDFHLIDKYQIGMRQVEISQGTITVKTVVNCP